MTQVLVCDAAHQPHHWTSREEAIVLKYKDLLQYETGESIIFRGGTSRITGERSQIDVGNIIFLKEVLRYDARTPPLTNTNLFIRDRHICGYCGRLYSDHKLSRDHIIPVSGGGQNIWQNVVTACKTCNHAKSDMTLDEADMELLYVPYVPSNVEKLIMQNRKILACQMDFLRSMLPAHSRLL